MSKRRRVLITGSRNWEDEDLIRKVLEIVWSRDRTAILVSGNCPTGADAMAERIWEGWGGLVERHPAAWRPNGHYDSTAGIRRNALMVNMGADWCAAFIRNNSPGATHCATIAERRGIPTKIWRAP